MATVNFPDHDINPKDKKESFHRDYAKAAWEEYIISAIKIGYNRRDRYAEIDDYYIGQQSIEKHKKYQLGHEPSQNNWVASDYTPRQVATKLINIAIQKIFERKFKPKATPIDLLARDETETYYNKIRAKIAFREQAMAINPALAKSPALHKEANEPADMEELEMMMPFGVKLKVAMEAEMGITLVHTDNNFEDLRRVTNSNIVLYGPGGYREWVDENGEVRERALDPKRLMMSWTEKENFSDCKHLGEITEVSIGDLPFDAETRKEIANAIKSNSTQVESSGDQNNGKAQVLDLEFKTWNDRIFERRQNDDGNVVHRRTKYSHKGADSKTSINGREVNKYYNKPVEMWQKVKWIVGTDYVYDWGECSYQKRDTKNKAKSISGFHLICPGMKKMRCSSLGDKLIPIIDDYNNTVFKIENFKAKWIPYIINMDVQAMESVALGAGGANMTPKEILELVFQNFTALGRRMDVNGLNQNYKMVEVEPTGMHQEYAGLAGDLARIYGEMRDVTGLNEITDASTPGERTLNYVANLGATATNNALSPQIYADRALSLSLSRGVILRLVQTIKNGNKEGVVRVLGEETARFITVTKDISERMWDIGLTDVPSDEERQMLIQNLSGKDQQGMLEPDDVVLIMQTDNLKQAHVLLAYKINKRKKEAQQYELQKMQMNGQVQQESTKVAGALDIKKIQLEKDLELRNQLAIKDKEKELLQIKLQAQYHQTETNNMTKIVTKEMENEQKDKESDKAAQAA